MLSLEFLKKKLRKQKVLFHRDYLRFQGGHLKVWHYFQHLKTTNIYSPQIYFTPASIQDKNTLWKGVQALPSWNPAQADILFLAGLDWHAVIDRADFRKNKGKKPIINLIQGLSHADPQDIKYKFLKEYAIRICVSKQVEDALIATGQVNGPLFTIPNGLDLSSLPTNLTYNQKDIDILIVAIKKPNLGRDIKKGFSSYTLNIELITELLPRRVFLELLSRSKICLCLPHFEEGFYLPALEAMALGAIVICPDCIGNRDFCIDQKNCFVPRYDQDSIAMTVERALDLSLQSRLSLLTNASATASQHSLKHEAEQFLAIMRQLKTLW